MASMTALTTALNALKGVTAKMSLSLSISGHTLVMESLELGPRLPLFESFTSLDALTLGPSLGGSVTKMWPEMERLSDIFAVTPCAYYVSFPDFEMVIGTPSLMGSLQ